MKIVSANPDDVLISLFESASEKRRTLLRFEWTPELAEAALKFNSRNRRIRKNYVEQLARTLRETGWAETHQGIAFSKDMVLVDGQHRLSAIIKAGVPARIDTTFGLEPGIIDVIDSHTKRLPSDVLQINGIKNSNAIAAIVRVCLSIERGLTHIDNYISSHEVFSYVEANREKLSDVASIITTLRRTFNTLRSGGVGAGLFMIAKEPRNSFAFAEFSRRLEDGLHFTSANDPISRLRSTFSARRLTPMEAYVFTIKAWNAFIANTPITLLRWTTDQSIPSPRVDDAAFARAS